MDQTDITASAGLRVVFLLVAAIMLALWGWSLVPPIQNWGNPNEDRFSSVPLFWATLTCLPVGLYLIARAAFARGRPGRARPHRALAGRRTHHPRGRVPESFGRSPIRDHRWPLGARACATNLPEQKCPTASWMSFCGS